MVVGTCAAEGFVWRRKGDSLLLFGKALSKRSDEEPAMMEGDEVYALLLHWSAKEALFKLMGVEEVDFIRHLRIFPFSLSEEGEFEACEYRTGRQERYRVRYVTHPDFVLTWIIK